MTGLAFRPATASRTIPDRLVVAWKRFVPAFLRWRERRRSRRKLADLDARMLRDIGLSPSQAEREVRKSFPWHDGRGMPRDQWR
jgi:uncharacterized protein YjiS (DUF1127 family)